VRRTEAPKNDTASEGPGRRRVVDALFGSAQATVRTFMVGAQFVVVPQVPDCSPVVELPLKPLVGFANGFVPVGPFQLPPFQFELPLVFQLLFQPFHGVVLFQPVKLGKLFQPWKPLKFWKPLKPGKLLNPWKPVKLGKPLNPWKPLNHWKPLNPWKPL
jgi:hypothetical protein